MKNSNIPNRWNCMDCSTNTSKISEHYFVRTEIWLQVVKDKYGMLCIGCLEQRLGRLLVKSDFTNCHINNPKLYSMSARLLNRLSC